MSNEPIARIGNGDAIGSRLNVLARICSNSAASALAQAPTIYKTPTISATIQAAAFESQIQVTVPKNHDRSQAAVRGGSHVAQAFL